MSQSTYIGDESELLFMVNATSRGLLVSRPVSAVCPYDVVVDNGKHLFKVQVKATSKEVTDGSYKISMKQTNDSQPYRADQIDFIAAHVQPLDVWYIIPVLQIVGVTCLSLRPQADNISRYCQYEGAWHLLLTDGLPNH